MTDTHDDLSRIIDAAAQNSHILMARSGELPLASYILTPDSIHMLVAGATDEFNKRMFAAVTRVAGAKHKARCTAVAMEAWLVLASTPEQIEEIGRLKAQGRSLSESSAAIERVVIIASDGHRQEVAEFDIVRHHDRMVELVEAKRERVTGSPQVAGMLTDVHARPDEIELPAFRRVMAEMDAMGLLDGQPLNAATPRSRAN